MLGTYEVRMQAAQREGRTAEQWYQSEPGLQHWYRAIFAQHAVEYSGQRTVSSGPLRVALLDHYSVMRRFSPDQARAMEQTRIDLKAPATAGRLPGDHSSFGPWLTGLFRHGIASPPACPEDMAILRWYRTRLKKLSQQNQVFPAREILTRTADLSSETMRCLVVRLMQADAQQKATLGYEPLPLLHTVMAATSRQARDTSLVVLYSVRLIQVKRFADGLRQLYHLQQDDAGFRQPYELLQHIYNFHQQGDGEVALKRL